MAKIKTYNSWGLTEEQLEYIKKQHEERIKKYVEDFEKFPAGNFRHWHRLIQEVEQSEIPS